jgi:hypothetical protein
VADRPFFRTGGGITVNLTSGGMERGARPIWDWWKVEAENGREDAGKAGRRKDGREQEGVDVIILSSVFVRTVGNIARC